MLIKLYFLILLHIFIQVNGKKLFNIGESENFYWHEMKSAMNPKVNPCDNFIEYACGNNQRSSLLTYNDFDAGDLLLDAFHEDNFPEISNVIEKARAFYKSCEISIDREIRKQVFNSGKQKWPFLSSDINFENYNWTDKIKWFGAYTNGLFEISIVSETTTILYMPFVALFKHKSLKNYNGEKLRIVMKQIGFEDTKMIEIISKEFDELVEKLLEIQEHKDENFVGEFNRKMTVAELSKRYPRVNWKREIETALQVKNISDDKELLIIDQKNALRYLDVILNTDPRITVNYINWMWMEIHLKDNCVEKMFKYFEPLQVSKILHLGLPVEERTRISDILKAGQNDLMEVAKMINKTRKFTKMFDRFELMLNCGPKAFEPENIKKEYESLEIDPENYTANNKVLNNGEYRAINWKIFKEECDPESLYYDISDILFKILFYIKMPSQVVFSRNFVNSISNEFTHFHGEEMINSIVSENRTIQKCVSNQIKENDLSFDYSYLGRSTIFKLTWNAYIKWLKNNNIPELSEEIRENYDLNNEKLLFVDLVQFWCDSPEKIDLIKSLANSEEFATAFKCPVPLPMSFSKKCDLF